MTVQVWVSNGYWDMIISQVVVTSRGGLHDTNPVFKIRTGVPSRSLPPMTPTSFTLLTVPRQSMITVVVAMVVVVVVVVVVIMIMTMV